MNSRQSGDTQSKAAAKAGISERTGRRIKKQEHQRDGERNWRSRRDPLEAVWRMDLLPSLEREPRLIGLTLWELLDEQYPGQYPGSVLRTCRTPRGFPTSHARIALSRLKALALTHLLYQFRLAFSGWRSVTVIQGGENYSALADGLQNALHDLGGASHDHRTDSLSAAWSTEPERKKLTQIYGGLCKHYGMKPTTNNTGVSHENGVIESAHGALNTV